MAANHHESEALQIWREKLAYLQKQEAVMADAAQKFALQHQINEAKAKIAELLSLDASSVSSRLPEGELRFEMPAATEAPPGSSGPAPKFKPLSSQDVHSVAVRLMKERGRTTTLDVKLQLRTEGLFAEQQSVSDAMKHLAGVHGWQATASHGHLVYTLPFNQKPEGTTSAFPDGEGIKKRRLVILVHGIRTRAEWTGRIRSLFEADQQTIVEPLGYEYFDVVRFLCPFWTRRKPIEVVLTKIRDALKLHRSSFDELIIVAHSFGTYIVGRILRENPEIEPDRLLLCGCIQPASYPWDRLPNRPKAVLNEAGSRDIWPILAKSITWGYGSTGTFGFQRPGVRDRYHNLAHSDYFKPGFAEEYWVPWIRDGVRRPSPYEIGNRPATPFYQNLPEIIPIKYFLLLALMILAVALWSKEHPGGAHGKPNRSHGTTAQFEQDQNRIVFPSMTAAELRVPAGTTNVIGPGQEIQSVALLVMESNSTIVLSSNVTKFQLYAKGVRLSGPCLLDARGMDGAPGSGGSAAAGQPDYGQKGYGGGRGANGGEGMEGRDVRLVVGVPSLTTLSLLRIKANGGAGGPGGRAGSGGLGGGDRVTGTDITNGGDGGDGGAGGNGGNGGAGGHVELLAWQMAQSAFTNLPPNYSQFAQIDTSGGVGGNRGLGGAGVGGHPGRTWRFGLISRSSNGGRRGSDGNAGSPGKQGQHGTNITEVIPKPNFISR
jgi:hypothetical protein